MIEAGTIIKDKYEIDEMLGVGGMANVYRAHDLNTNTVVAIKVLKDEYRNNAEFKLRFEREARAGLTLSHRNIVKPLDYGDFEGAKYIVFEYIDGYTLKDLIKRSAPLQPKTAINIIQQVLFALEHAHEKGIIHRDIKPQNVMITSDGIVKLADFGIARVSAASTKTFGGSNIMGSVHYISPEQVRGDEVTEKSDLYSVGIMLYEMLTGTVPFDSDNQISVAVKHLNTPIKPPMEINPKLSTALNDVILKATVKNPKFRYDSVADLRYDLERALREPTGEFARLNIPIEETQYKASKVNKGVKNVAIILSAVLAFCIVLFIIVSVTYNAKHLFVPNLIGKSYNEAVEIVGDDFKLLIVNSEESNEYPSGSIISQQPSWKTRALAGSTIEVTLSLDSEMTIVPDLFGMSLLEASNALSNAGLLIEKVIYNAESQIADGKVCDQSPQINEQVKRNSKVTIYISGTPEETADMPVVMNKDFTTAISTLNSFGFTNIRVRYTTTGNGKEGHVTYQNISGGLNIDKSTLIELEVYGNRIGAYAVDKAFNLSIAEKDTPVLITVKMSEGYEVVVFESKLPSGTQVASFTAYSDVEGVFDCIVYVNGVEQKKEQITFKRSQ